MVIYADENALSVNYVAISREHSSLRRFSYKQFSGLFALRIAPSRREAFVRCGGIYLVVGQETWLTKRI